MSDVRTLLRGLIIGESPRWHEDRLWFCHWGAHEIVAVESDGASEIVTHDSQTSPHSPAWLPDGRQLIVPGTVDPRGRLLRREPDGSLVPHADLSSLPSGVRHEASDAIAAQDKDVLKQPPVPPGVS